MARRVITAQEQYELAEPFLRLAAPEEPLAEWEKDLMAGAETEATVPSGITADILKKHYPDVGDYTNEKTAEDWFHGGDIAAQKQRAHEHLTKLTTPGHSFYSPEPGSHADRWKAIHQEAFGEPWTGEVEHSDKGKNLAQDAADAFAPAGFKVKTQDEFFKDHAPAGSGPQPKAAEPKAIDPYAADALSTFLESANDKNFFGGDNNDEWATEAAAVNSPDFAEWFATKFPTTDGYSDEDGQPLYPDVVVQEYLKEKGQGSAPPSTKPAATPDTSGMDENLQNFFRTDADYGNEYSELANNDHFKDWFNQEYPYFNHGDMFPQDVVFEYQCPWNTEDYHSQPLWMQQMSYSSDADDEIFDWQKEVGPEQIHDWKEDYDDGGYEAVQSFHKYLDNKGIDHPDDLDVVMHTHNDTDTTDDEYDYWKGQLPSGAYEYFVDSPHSGGYDFSEWKDYYNGETLHYKSNWPEGPHKVDYGQMYSDQGYGPDVPDSLTSGYDSFVPGFKAYMVSQYHSLEQYDINNFDRDDWSDLEQGWHSLSQDDKYKLQDFENHDLHPHQPDEKFKPTPAAQASTPTPVPTGPVVPFATPFPANENGLPTTEAGYQALADTIWPGSAVTQSQKKDWVETQASGYGSGNLHEYLATNYPQQWQNWQTQQGGAQPAAAPQGTSQVTPQMVIDHLVGQPGSSWQWNPQSPSSSSGGLIDLSKLEHPDQLKSKLEQWASSTTMAPPAVEQAKKTLDALFGAGAQQAAPKTALDYKPKTEAEWNKFFQILGDWNAGGPVSDGLKSAWKTQSDVDWALNLKSPVEYMKTWMAHHDSQPQETASSTFHQQLVTSPEFKAWFKKDNSFDLDKDDKDGSLKKMLLDPTNDWTMSKLIQFRNAQPKAQPGAFDPDSFTADYKNKFPDSGWTATNFSNPEKAKNILEGIINEDVDDGVGYYDGDDYDDEEDAENYAAFPNYQIYQDAVDEWEYQKEQAQELYDKYFGDDEDLDDQGAPGYNFGQDDAANQFGQLLNNPKFYDWVTGKTGEVNAMAQMFYPKYPQYALDAWEAKQKQSGAAAPISSYTPQDIAQAAADFGWHTTAENYSGQTLEEIKENLNEIVGNQTSSGSLKAKAQQLLDKFFGGAPTSPPVWKPPAHLQVPSTLLGHDGGLAPGVLQWMRDEHPGNQEKKNDPAMWLGWISGDDGHGSGWGPGDWKVVADNWANFSSDTKHHWINQPMPEGLAAALGQSSSSPAAAPAFDALQVATEYGKILGMGSDVHGGGTAYKDMSYEQFKNKLKSNIQKAKDGSFYPEHLAKFQALYDKHFGQPQPQPQAATPQGPVNFGDTSPLKIPVSVGLTPATLMSGNDLDPDFQKWLWDKRDKNMSPETFLAAVKSWTPEHWRAVEDAFLGTGQPAGVSADPEALKDQLTVLWNIQNENGKTSYVPAGGSYKQWTNNLSPEALQHFIDNPTAGYGDFAKFMNSKSQGGSGAYTPPVFPASAPVAGSYAPGYDGPPAEWMQKHYSGGGWSPESTQKWWNATGKNSMAADYWNADSHGDKADFPLPSAPAGKTVAPVPFTGGVDFAKEYMEATNWTGGTPELINSAGVKFSEMTAEQAKKRLENFLDGTEAWGNMEVVKPKVQALYDKYFGQGAAAPAAQGAANFDATALAQEAADIFGGAALAHTVNYSGKKIKDMTYDEARKAISQGVQGNWGTLEQPKWKALYDKYFGSGAPAGPAPLVSDNPHANHALIEQESEQAKGYGFTVKMYNLLHKKPGMLQSWMKLSPAEKAVVTDDIDSGNAWAKEHENDLYQPEGSTPSSGGHDYDKISQLAQKMSHGGGGKYITNTADWMTWVHGLSPSDLAYFTNDISDANKSFEKFLQFTEDGDYDDDPYYALKQWYEDNHGTTDGFYNLAKNPQEFGKFYDQWAKGSGNLGTFTEEPEVPAYGTGVSSGNFTPADMLAADGSYTQLALDYMKQSGWPVPNNNESFQAHHDWNAANWGAVLSQPGPANPEWNPNNQNSGDGGKYLNWEKFKEVHGGEQAEAAASSIHIPSWVTTSEAGKKYFPNGPQEYPGFAEFFKQLKAAGSTLNVSGALDEWKHKPQYFKGLWIEKAGDSEQAAVPAPTKPNFYDQFQAIMGHDPAKVEKNKQTIADEGVDWVKDQIKKRLKIETDPEKFVKLVDLWQKNFGGPTGSGAITPLLKKHKPGQPLDQATLVKLWQLKDTGELPDWIKNAPADTSGDIWPTYEEQDDPLGGGGGAPAAASGTINPEIPDNLGLAASWATDKGLSIGWFNGSDHTQEEKKEILLKHINETDYFNDEQKAKLQQVYDKFFGDGAAAAAPQPLPEYDKNAFAQEVAGLLSSDHHTEDPGNWDYGSAEYAKKALQGKIKDSTAAQANIPIPNTELLQNLQKVYDKWFGADPAQPSGGSSFEEMKAKIKAADPNYWANHPEKFKDWGQEDWLDELKTMVLNSKSHPSAFKPGEVDTYKEIINQLEGAAPAPQTTISSEIPDTLGEAVKWASPIFNSNFFDSTGTYEDITEEKKKAALQSHMEGTTLDDQAKAKLQQVYDKFFGEGAAAPSASSTAGGTAPAQYPPGISSWSGSGSSAPPSMSEIVKGQISTLMDKLRAPESKGIYNEDDISTAQSPDFQKWFRDAPAPYRQTTSRFPYMALEDYEKGGEYGWVPESTGDIARVYDPYTYPESDRPGTVKGPNGERLKLPGDWGNHYPSHTINPLPPSHHERPPLDIPNRPPDVPGQLEIPLPDGSSWEPDKKWPVLRRGIDINLNRYKPGNPDHKLLSKPGFVGEQHRRAAQLLDEIKELVVGSKSIHDADDTIPSGDDWEPSRSWSKPLMLWDDEDYDKDFVEGQPTVPDLNRSYTSGTVDKWLKLMQWAKENDVPPEQMWQIAKDAGHKNPDEFGSPPQAYFIEQARRNPAKMAKEVSRLIGADFEADSLSEVANKLKKIKKNSDYGTEYDKDVRYRAEHLYDKWFGSGFMTDLLAHKIAECVETGAWKPSEFKSHPNPGGMGPHWTTKGVDQLDFGDRESDRPSDTNIPIQIVMEWPGWGEDPDSKDGAKGFKREKEITLNPGAQGRVTQLTMRHPYHESHDRLVYDFEHPQWRSASITPRRQGRAVLSHRERYAVDDDPGADFDVWPDPYENRPINFGQPTSLKTPRYDEHTRPVHDNGEYYFSPDEINPPSSAASRPDIKWIGREPEQDVLPDIDFPEEAAPGIPIDRHAQPLFRGLSLDLTHPDAAEIFRMVYGHHPDDHHLFDLDHTPEARYDHPELARAILDHLESARQPTHGLGRHWSLDPSEAHGFAISEALSLLNDPDSIQLPVRLRADWRGAGENPYRHETGETRGQFASEMEMNMLPGANMNIGDVQIRHPHLNRWVSLDHQPQHRHAQHTTVRPRSAKRILTHREMMEG